MTCQTTWDDDSLRLLRERLARTLPPRDLSAWIPYVDRPGCAGNAARERLAVRMTAQIPEMVCMVRDEGPEAIGAVLRKLTASELRALVVVALAHIPDDVPQAELLAWADWDTAQGRKRMLRQPSGCSARRQEAARSPVALRSGMPAPGNAHERSQDDDEEAA